MAEQNREPSFVYYGSEGDGHLVGEFHYGSASDPKVLEPGKGIKTFLTDPPYNLGFDYGPEVNDRQPEEDYHQMMEDVFDACYEAADDNANLFIIHYPQDLAKMWPRLTKRWRFHQWITWAYPANFGHSTKRWSNASRTILWLVKGSPEFHGQREVQPYRNPTARRIRKLIHEEGQIGTKLYNWWVVNLCKNVSRDKRDYSNQIPEELLERIILSTTNEGDIVADPFSGTFSTSRTAMRLGRRAWGCDLNPEVIKWRPTISDYQPDPDIPEQQYDREYPLYEFMEAGLTEGQLNRVVSHLLRNSSAEQLARAPGIGIGGARAFKERLASSNGTSGPSRTSGGSGQSTLGNFSSEKSSKERASREDDGLRIGISREMFDSQTKMTRGSKEIRESMIQCSMRWDSGSQENRVFSESGNKIGRVSLEYGKPGMFAGVSPGVSTYKPMDMRPRISTKPEWVPDAWELYAPISELWTLDEVAAREVNSILMRIAWCECFSQNERGEFVLDLDEQTIRRIEQIDSEYSQCFRPYSLSEIILFIEGIAHTDDTNQFQPNRNGKVDGQSGRIRYIKTTIKCARNIADVMGKKTTEKERRKNLAKFINDISRSKGMTNISQSELEQYVLVFDK